MASTKLLLMERSGGSHVSPNVMELRSQLDRLPSFSEATVTPQGRNTVYVTVEARNVRERDKLKSELENKVNGWEVLEENTYSLPKTF